MLAHATQDQIAVTDLGSSVLVGLDGSPESLVAARQATRLLEEDGSLGFVSAVAPFVTSLPAFGNAAVLHELEDGARTLLREAQERWPQAETTLGFGTAAEVVLDTARKRRSTLVAVGGGGHRRLPGIVLGAVATHLLHRAPCSVLVARERDGGLAFPRTILAGTDGSPEGNAAVRAALRLGERFGAPVRALIATGGDDPVDEGAVVGADEIEWSELAPVDALVRAAAGADLVVLGSRGLRGVRALGSVSERVGHAAPCSVLVVRNLPT